MSHTKEPWECRETLVFLGNEGGFDLRGAPNAKENARRIVACVNWCAGNSTEAMELAVKIGRPCSVERDKATRRELELIKQRDKLLEVLNLLLAEYACEQLAGRASWGPMRRAVQSARAVIAAEGQPKEGNEP